MEMPAANKRIQDLVKKKTNGKVLPYLKLLNEGKDESEHISHQRLNRLFKVDERANKWPTVPHDILEAILIRFPEVDAYWLVTGKEKSDTGPDCIKKIVETEVQQIQVSLNKLSQAVSVPFGLIPGVAPAEDLLLGKSQAAENEGKPKDKTSRKGR